MWVRVIAEHLHWDIHACSAPVHRCPHAAIREDISANLTAMEELQAEFNPQLQFVESGGDNLAASYSMELVSGTSTPHLVHNDKVCTALGADLPLRNLTQVDFEIYGESLRYCCR